MFFNQYIFRLKSHPTQEYSFLTLNCKMSIKAGASRSDIDIITWKRSSCIHQKPCNKTMLFYLKSSVYEKKKSIKKNPWKTEINLHFENLWLIYSLISQYLHYMMLQQRVLFSFFFFLPLPDRFLDHLIYIQYIERQCYEQEKYAEKNCQVKAVLLKSMISHMYRLP